MTGIGNLENEKRENNKQNHKQMKNETAADKKRLEIKYLGYAFSPALLYTALSGAVYSLSVEAGITDSKIMLQAVSVSVCLLYFGWRAFKEQLSFRSAVKSVYRFPASFCYVTAAVMCGLLNNYLYLMIVSKTGEFSSGYGHVTGAFYTGRLAAEIVTLCMIGPLAEELVYRGFVYGRLRARCSENAAAVLSALIFGILHFNLVQGVYAFVLGIILAHIVYKTGSLSAAAAAHMAANLVSVLWTETELLDFLNQQGSGRYFAAVCCLLLMGIFLSYGNRLCKRYGK